MNLRGLAGVVAGLVAAAAWILIPGHSLYSNITDDALALGCLATIVAFVAVAIGIVVLLNREVHTGHRRRITVFRMIMPFALVVAIAVLLTLVFAPMFTHFHFSMKWFADMWRTRGFIADFIAFGVIALAVFWPSPKPTARTDASRSLTDPSRV